MIMGNYLKPFLLLLLRLLRRVLLLLFHLISITPFVVVIVLPPPLLEEPLLVSSYSYPHPLSASVSIFPTREIIIVVINMTSYFVSWKEDRKFAWVDRGRGHEEL